MQLRDYQIAAVTDILSDESNVCLVSPTGSGKTTMGAELAARLGGRICWVAHREELVAQAKATLDRAFNAHGWGGLQELVVTTIQSLKPYDCDWLFIDECHHYAADKWSDIQKTIVHKRRIGLTATPTRADGKALNGLFDRIVVAAQYSQLLAQGHICPCRIHAGSDIGSGLSKHPVKAWLELGRAKTTIAFAPGVSEAEDWTRQMKSLGVRAECITGETDEDTRRETLAKFAHGEVTVLWNVFVLTEGVDVPQVSCVLLARAFEHQSTYLQCVGRGLRPHKSKKFCLVIDLVGAYIKHGIPTQDRIYGIGGKKPIQRGKVMKLHQCVRCGGVTEIRLYRDRTCPVCSYVQPPQVRLLKIFDDRMSEVWDGRDTAQHEKDAALARMRAVQLTSGKSLQWLRDVYKEHFGIYPVIRDATHEEKARSWESIRRMAKSYGQALHIFEARFGCMPEGMSWGRVRG